VLNCREVDADVFHGRKGYPKACLIIMQTMKKVLCKLIQFVAYNTVGFALYILIPHTLIDISLVL